MRYFRVISAFALLFALASCAGRKELVPKAATFITVDGSGEDSSRKVSSEGASFDVEVTCDALWDVTVPEEAQTWIVTGEIQKGKKNSYTVPVSVYPSSEEHPRSADILFSGGTFHCVLTIVQDAPDPLTLNRVQGFYGLEGGDVILGGKLQGGCFHSSGMWSYRIMDPESLTVWVLGDIPEELSSGESLTLRFKNVSEGMDERLLTFTDVLVVKSTSSLVWLRKDASTYFIVER